MHVGYCFWFRLSLDLGLQFVCFHHFVPVLFASVVLGLAFFQYYATGLARKNVSKMTRFLSSGT